jgi:PQQ-dependent catabolism-associated CXXCW motif protein
LGLGGARNGIEFRSVSGGLGGGAGFVQRRRLSRVILSRAGGSRSGPGAASGFGGGAGVAAGRDALFIDAQPLARDGTTGRWLQTEPHDTIPGAIWRPEVGRPGVDPALWSGLRGRIDAWRRGHPGAPVVLYCRVDCWMGWNAARRLARDGLREVYWMAEGVEGWRDAGGTLAPSSLNRKNEKGHDSIRHRSPSHGQRPQSAAHEAFIA